MHYVIGDVHGCFDEMIALLKKIESNDLEATFIFVGDFVDRGPQVIETLEWIKNNIKEDGKYQTVLGNHEAMLIDWHDSVIKSFRESHPENENIPDKELPLKKTDYFTTNFDFKETLSKNNLLKEDYIYDIIKLFEKWPLFKRVELGNEKWYIAHACVPFDHNVDEILKDCKNNYKEYYGYPEDFLWERIPDKINHPDESIILVHGHTPTVIGNKSRIGEIHKSKNIYNIDGGCVFGKLYPDEYKARLNAICIETKEEFYIECER